MTAFQPPNGLSKTLLAETQRLRAAWQRHDAAFLDTYLIRDVEDPRINIQSILTRHFLIRELFQDRYADIMEHELYFALTVNWLLALLKSSRPRNEIHLHTGAVLDGLLAGDEDKNATAVPPFIAEAFGKLAFPNYISELLMWVPREHDTESMPEYLLNIFQRIWAETLALEQARPIRVIEPACGSANDYRFLVGYGLDTFLDYTGLDICEKNISNALRRFPDIDFQTASIFDIPADDKGYDYCFVHDLFEHLSPEGIGRAVSEIYRVTKSRIFLHFFNMDDIDEDVISRKNGYHWNRLSSPRMKNRFFLQPTRINEWHLTTWLDRRFVWSDYHNPYARSWRIDVGAVASADRHPIPFGFGPF